MARQMAHQRRGSQEIRTREQPPAARRLLRGHELLQVRDAGRRRMGDGRLQAVRHRQQARPVPQQSVLEQLAHEFHLQGAAGRHVRGPDLLHLQSQQQRLLHGRKLHGVLGRRSVAPASHVEHLRLQQIHGPHIRFQHQHLRRQRRQQHAWLERDHGREHHQQLLPEQLLEIHGSHRRRRHQSRQSPRSR